MERLHSGVHSMSSGASVASPAPKAQWDLLGVGDAMVGGQGFGNLGDSKGTHSVSLHSRKASCSGQSPSTLGSKAEKDREGH